MRASARPRFLRNEDDLGHLLRVRRNTFLNAKRAEARRLVPRRPSIVSTRTPVARQLNVVVQFG
jgi:hypothetical protein